VPASILKSSINRESKDFQKNSHHIVEPLNEIKNQEEIICQGGGAKAIESQRKKGRLTARERIAKLIDPNTHFFELSLFAAFEMYEEGQRALRRNRLSLAKICGRLFMLIANDATVKAGAFFR
jgi:acetyl-CoA carboxylase carboxyltransferase component